MFLLTNHPAPQLPSVSSRNMCVGEGPTQWSWVQWERDSAHLFQLWTEETPSHYKQSQLLRRLVTGASKPHPATGQYVILHDLLLTKLKLKTQSASCLGKLKDP